MAKPFVWPTSLATLVTLFFLCLAFTGCDVVWAESRPFHPPFLEPTGLFPSAERRINSTSCKWERSRDRDLLWSCCLQSLPRLHKTKIKEKKTRNQNETHFSLIKIKKEKSSKWWGGGETEQCSIAVRDQSERAARGPERYRTNPEHCPDPRAALRRRPLLHSPSRRVLAGGETQPLPQSPANSRLNAPRTKLGAAILSSPSLPSLPLPPAERRALGRHVEARQFPVLIT